MTATITSVPEARVRPAPRIPAILAALGGRFGWRFWWPLAVWLLDALTIVTFRGDRATEPAGALWIASMAAVGVLWFWGARFAVSLGHPRRTVHLVTAVASVVLCLGTQAIAALARIAEVAVVGNGNARIFVVTLYKDGDQSQFFGFGEMIYLLYGFPLVGVIILVACWALGRGWLGGFLAALVGGVGVVAYLKAWGALDRLVTGDYQVQLGVMLATLFVALCAVGGWFGFRRVSIA